jgi:hypothetical protein
MLSDCQNWPDQVGIAWHDNGRVECVSICIANEFCGDVQVGLDFATLIWPHLKAEPVNLFWGFDPGSEDGLARRRSKVELYEQIRQEYELGAGTIRAVAWRLGVHRREVRRALASAVSAERKKAERERPKLEPALPFIDAILEADRRAPRKQRHTAHRIWTRLRQEKPEVSTI